MQQDFFYDDVIDDSDKTPEEYIIHAQNIKSKQRLDIFLSLELKSKNNLSRSYIQNLIKHNNILVNQKCTKPNYIIKENDEIRIKIPEPEILDIKPENINLDIVYEDDQIMVINKPQNLTVHPGAGNFSGTLVNGLVYYLRNNNSGLSDIGGKLRPGIVHRIDKNTSGIIVIAKNNSAHKFLSEQFAEHKITREYIAIVTGNLYLDGVINKPIGRDINNRKKMAINPNGRRAVTHYSIIKNFNGYSLIKLKLETGRTHQIRVHMASIKHYILGDDIYGQKDKKFGLIGQALHARKLGFIHPTTKKYIEFNQKPPRYFLELIKKLMAISYKNPK